MQKSIVFVLVLAADCLYCEARRFATQCDLVNELRKQGFPEEHMSDWVCLIEDASGRATHKISPLRLNGSRDYGLFQINDNYWCSNTGLPGRDCNVTCVDLLANDITKAAVCAKLIYNRQNFMAWYGWRNYCLGETLPDVSHCQ